MARKRKSDPAHEETDELLKKIEKEIAKEYKTAHGEVTKKFNDYMQKYKAKDDIWQKKLAQAQGAEKAKLQGEYQRWMTGQVMIGKRWGELKDTLATDYSNAAKIASSVANGYRPEVYAINHNYGTFEVEKGSMMDTSYTLYSRETVERMFRENPKIYHDAGRAKQGAIAKGELKQWERQKIQSVMIQGVLQGESIPKLTKRLQKVTNEGYAASVRNARTMMTGVQNAGRIDAFERANSMGIKTRKQWLATLDDRTRHAHRELDGAIEEDKNPFTNSLGEIMYPGDPNAAPANLYNCRCTLIPVVDGINADVSDISLRRNEKLGGMTYEEWKGAKEEEEGGKKAHLDASGDKSMGEGKGGLPEPSEGLKTSAPKIDGKDIYDGWEWDKGKYPFAIEQAIHDQGFDGLPQVVGREDFDRAVAESGMISQRVYTAPDQETLGTYRDSLLNGKWYVDCSAGGCTEGQGMYVAADYTGSLSDGIKSEMQKYIDLGQQRYEYQTKMSLLENLSMKDIPDGLSEKDLEIIKKYYSGMWDRNEVFLSNLKYSEEQRAREIKEEIGLTGKSIEQKARSHIADNPMAYKVETITMSADSKIIKMDDLEAMMNKDGLTGDEDSELLYRGKAKFYDAGIYAALHGYDAINAEGYGRSGSYTVILNRTKTYILNED